MTMHIVSLCKKEGEMTKLRLVGSKGKRAIASANLFFLHTNTRVYAYLHDVSVVDQYRGRGFGKIIVQAVVGCVQVYANEHKQTVRLQFTSRPSNKRANGLYKISIGGYGC